MKTKQNKQTKNPPKTNRQTNTKKSPKTHTHRSQSQTNKNKSEQQHFLFERAASFAFLILNKKR